jgi:hypothetical protein
VCVRSALLTQQREVSPLLHPQELSSYASPPRASCCLRCAVLKGRAWPSAWARPVPHCAAPRAWGGGGGGAAVGGRLMPVRDMLGAARNNATLPGQCSGQITPLLFGGSLFYSPCTALPHPPSAQKPRGALSHTAVQAAAPVPSSAAAHAPRPAWYACGQAERARVQC